jgi:uncharacterized protein
MLKPLPVRQSLQPVEALVLYLTEECNLRCNYCFVKKRPRCMTLDVARKAVDYFLRSDISNADRSRNIHLFGGEPLLEVPLIEALTSEYQSVRNLQWSITTNGTLFSERIETLLKSVRMNVLISIDGDRQHNQQRRFRGGRSSYDLVAKNFPRLVAASSKAYARVTFFPDSLDLVGKVKHALELGAPWVILAPVVEADWRASQGALAEAYQKLGDWVLEELSADRLPPLSVTWDAVRKWHGNARTGRRPEKACSVGHSILAVEPDGNLMPCHRFLYRPDYWLGHLSDPVPRDLHGRVHDLIAATISDCHRCIARPICGGGCRVLSLQSGGGLDGVHPFHCLVTVPHAGLVQRIYEYLLQHDEFAGFFEAPISNVPASFVDNLF